jgi:hypothetical protein
VFRVDKWYKTVVTAEAWFSEVLWKFAATRLLKLVLGCYLAILQLLATSPWCLCRFKIVQSEVPVRLH